jgi:hypothetical protein
MNRSTICAALTVVATCAAPVFATPIQWAAGNGHYYDVVLVADQVTWDAALDSAAGTILNGVPGHLATITSQAEQDFIVGHFGNAVRAKWLGGFQPPGSIEPSDGWQWITGEPFVYSNWRIGEPNNSGGNENRLEFFTANFDPLGVWSDLNGESPPATFVNGYVVEFVPEPSTAFLASLGVGLILLARCRRKR